jgi:hypothetical protein
MARTGPNRWTRFEEAMATIRAELPVLLNLSTLQPSLRRGLAAGNPFGKILRGIRRL